MAMEAQDSPHFHFPLSDLGPCELSYNIHSEDYYSEYSVFWSTNNDELLRCHHQRLLLIASNNGDPTIKDKIKCALQEVDPYFLIGAGLVQFWGLVNIGDCSYLTTCDHPFALIRWLAEEISMEGLCRYRKHCLEYLIGVDDTSVEKGEGELGPPGRVFRSGLPEHVSDVSIYSSKEYPQRDLAVQYGKSYLAWPVYRSPGNICIGVLEFLSSRDYSFFPWTKYQHSLKVVGLKTNRPVSLHNYKQSTSCHEKEINEIDEVLKVVRRRYLILDARTWIEAYSKEQLTVLRQGDHDPCFMDTSRFCFIWKGHGVVGKAFSSKSAYFCKDITQLSITEYPYVPSARKYGFSSCFAICLQSSCPNGCIYTLEFFLSTDKTCYGNPRIVSHMIIDILNQQLQSSFRVASGQELGQNLVVEVIKITPDDELNSFEICHDTGGGCAPIVVEEQNEVGVTKLDGSFQRAEAAQQNLIVGSAPTPEHAQNVESTSHQQPIVEFDVAIPAREMEHYGNARDDAGMERDGNATDDAGTEHNGNAKDGAVMEDDGNAIDDASMEHDGNARDETTNLRKRASSFTLESELGITLEVLEQFSAVKVEAAAKALGVSRSTLKRICRRYNIRRWPPCKAGKFNLAINRQEIGQPSKKNTGKHSMSAAKELQDESSILVKATHESDKKWFKLSLSARKMDLDEKVATQFNLPIGSFKIKYQDVEEDWISISCDEDLSIPLNMLRLARQTAIKMSVFRGL